MIHLTLDTRSSTPLFRQIIDQISRAIRSGELAEGSQLPSERELCEQLGLARGTVKKAYEELSREGLIEIRRGQGTFVSRMMEPAEAGRKEVALRRIGMLLDELERMRFTPREIENLIYISLMEREEMKETFHMAAVDCNTESLDMFHKQLAYMKGIDLKKFLLSEILEGKSSAAKLEPFKLILVTSTHYQDLIRAIPSLKDRIVQVVVSPSPETILELGNISPKDAVGIVCESKTFSQIIQNKMKELRISPKSVKVFYIKERKDLEEFIKETDVLLIPPGYSFPISKENKVLFQEFRERGGKIISFEYRIERGSLIHLEERIKEAWA